MLEYIIPKDNKNNRKDWFKYLVKYLNNTDTVYGGFTIIVFLSMTI
jgi:hypothetical protein